MYIKLTQQQAEAVGGESSDGAILMPILTADGFYILPERVLQDEAHSSKHAFLKTLPTVNTIKQLSAD